MRAKEFITERKFTPKKSGPLKATFMFPTMPSADPYQIYRFGMAMADHTIDHAKGPTDRNAVIIAYAPEEEAIIQAGTRQTGHKGVLVADKESHEPNDTTTTSPVSKPKRNRYGV